MISSRLERSAKGDLRFMRKELLPISWHIFNNMVASSVDNCSAGDTCITHQYGALEGRSAGACFVYFVCTQIALRKTVRKYIPLAFLL